MTDTWADRFKANLGIAKSLFELLRDLLIFAVLAMLFLIPGFVKDRLTHAGIQSIDAAGVKWQAQAEAAKVQTSAAVDHVARVQIDSENLRNQLEALARSAATPGQKSVIEKLAADAKASADQIQTANTILTRSLAVQDSALRQVDAQSATRAGWIFLGRITQDKSDWARGAGRTVDVDWPLHVGAQIAVNADANIHGDPNGGQHRDASVLGAIRAGEKITIDDIDTTSHWAAGGWTVWVRVKTS